MFYLLIYWPTYILSNCICFMCYLDVFNNLSVGQHLLAWPKRTLNRSEFALLFVGLHDRSSPNPFASFVIEFTWEIDIFHCLFYNLRGGNIQ